MATLNFSIEESKLSYGARGGSSYGNQRRGSGRKRGKKSIKPDYTEGAYTAKELHQQWAASPGSGLYEAQGTALIFKPTGQIVRLMGEQEAAQEAAEKNHTFYTSSPYVGLEIAGQKVIASGVPKDSKFSFETAILDNGKTVTLPREQFDQKLREHLANDPNSPWYRAAHP